ncbi:MAG TPA: CoA transferase [Bacillota bacterium]
MCQHSQTKPRQARPDPTGLKRHRLPERPRRRSATAGRRPARYLARGIPVRTGNHLQRFVPSNFYPTRDGYVAILIGSENQWAGLAAAKARFERLYGGRNTGAGIAAAAVGPAFSGA